MKLIALLALPVLVAASVRPVPTTQPKSFSDYSILLDRNIFSRFRTFSRGHRTSLPNQGPSRPPQFQVLTGVVEQDGAYVAFIEDTRDGTTTRYKVGDTLLQGKIKQIGFDSLETDAGGALVRVEIGMNLEGAAPADVSGPTTAPAAEGSATPGGQTLPANANEVIERLKQNRLREIKQ